MNLFGIGGIGSRQTAPSAPAKPEASDQGVRMQSGATASGSSFELGSVVTAMRTGVSNLSERVVQWLADDRYKGAVLSVSGRTSSSFATFTAGDEVGSGALGVVHHVTVKATAEFMAEYPELFVGGEPRADLVIKFPHRLPVTLPRQYDPVAALRDEIKDAAFFSDQLPDAPIPGAKVLYASDGWTPFVIKPFVKAVGLGALAGSQAGRLTDAQRRALRKQIFEKAERVHRQSGVALDIKPKNLAWDPQADAWVMYEYTRLPAQLSTYFTGGGFDAYVRMFELMMRQEAERTRK